MCYVESYSDIPVNNVGMVVKRYSDLVVKLASSLSFSVQLDRRDFFRTCRVFNEVFIAYMGMSSWLRNVFSSEVMEDVT